VPDDRKLTPADFQDLADSIAFAIRFKIVDMLKADYGFRLP
jgi:hypothetical protein